MPASRQLLRAAADPREILLRRLSTLVALSAGERALVHALPLRTEVFAAGTELLEEGRIPTRARVLIAGWACRQRVLPDGRRQIFSFILPGDGVGLCGAHRMPALSTVAAVTPVELIDAEPFRELVLGKPSHHGLSLALIAAERAEEALLLAQIVRLGRQNAYERVAHFLLEVRDRLATIGLGDQAHFPMPLIQETLADALGMSIVHVNRTLQQLRRDELIEMHAGAVRLRRPELLTAAADYRPARSAMHAPLS